MGLTALIKSFINEPSYTYGLVIGLAARGELDSSLEEELKEKVADRMEKDLTEQLEEERDELLERVQYINKLSEIQGNTSPLPQAEDEETEEESNEPGLGYIG